MRLADDWRDVLRKAWSIRWILIAGFFSGLEVAVPYLENVLPIRRGMFALLGFIASNAAFVTRLVAQRNLAQPEKEKP